MMRFLQIQITKKQALNYIDDSFILPEIWLISMLGHIKQHDAVQILKLTNNFMIYDIHSQMDRQLNHKVLLL